MKMRIDMCRKCGNDRKKYEESESCKVCGRDFEQFVCQKCGIVTEPQYHIHRIQLETVA